MTGPLTLALDPGVTGALVGIVPGARLPCDVVQAIAWRPVAAAGYRVEAADGASTTAASLHEAIWALRWPARYVLVAEGLFVQRLALAPSTLTLAEAAGEAIGALRPGMDALLRVSNMTWRRKVYPRSGRLDADGWAKRSLQCAPLLGDLGALARNEHACDALAMAYYGMVKLGRR